MTKDNNLKIISKHIGHGSAMDDIFNNEFDITFFKTNQTMTSDHPKRLTILPHENTEDDGTVEYIYNNEYYRCDDFRLNHSGHHILFAGCSQTEGMGGNLNTVWAKMLYDSLSHDTSLDGYFNIARAGYGWQKVISNFLIYESRYGTPEYLFILLPDVARMFHWSMHKKTWIYTQKVPSNIGIYDDDDVDKLLTEKDHRESFIDFAAGWKLFEAYCKAKNIKMLWSMWDYEEEENLRRFVSMENYVSLNVRDFQDYIKAVRPDGKLEKFDLFKRDGHLGTLANEYWALSFNKRIKELGWLK